MKRGAIEIENNTVSVELAGGTVWLSQHRIADLFGVFVSAVGSNVRAILKSGVLDERQVCREYTDTNGSITMLYNLEMITALAFRLRSPQVLVFRKWILNHGNRIMVMWNPPESNHVLAN